MQTESTEVCGVLLITPRVFDDQRGWFLETFNIERYRASGIAQAFVQDNVSFSKRGVLRGLHLQCPNGQAKLVSVLAGEIFDVAVDVRIGSPSFGRWVGRTLSSENHQQLLIPEGCAHGFAVLSESALVAYKCSAPYMGASEISIRWDDPALRIDWPVREPILSVKDAAAPRLSAIDQARLPRFSTEKAACESL